MMMMMMMSQGSLPVAIPSPVQGVEEVAVLSLVAVVVLVVPGQK